MTTPKRAVRIPPHCDETLGLDCVDKSTPGLSVWRMTADERFANPVGVMQGGFLAAMADSAMGAATISHARARGRRVRSSSIEMKVSFLAAVVVGADLRCTARVVRGGRRVVFAEADIIDERGTEVARASSSYLLTDLADG
jgi:uncharacterized protein (TIGR00369 family)